MKKEIKFYPAWDKRSTESHKNYGIQGTILHFIVSDEKGASDLTVDLNWYLPQNREIDLCEMEVYPSTYWQKPLPINLGHHSPIRLHEWEFKRDSCEILARKPCYSSVSALDADKYFEILVSEGQEGLFKALEEYHKEIFFEEEKKDERKK